MAVYDLLVLILFCHSPGVLIKRHISHMTVDGATLTFGLRRYVTELSLKRPLNSHSFMQAMLLRLNKISTLSLIKSLGDAAIWST